MQIALNKTESCYKFDPILSGLFHGGSLVQVCSPEDTMRAPQNNFPVEVILSMLFD